MQQPPEVQLHLLTKVEYRNHRGLTATRTIVPRRVWFGSTEWHPAPQWLVDVDDIDRQVERTFAYRDITWPPAPDTEGAAQP